jgi:hypothetical protein
MITAMNALLTMIIAIAALTALAWVGAYLYDLVRTDGYGRRPANRAPRSHVADVFDPDRYRNSSFNPNPDKRLDQHAA